MALRSDHRDLHSAAANDAAIGKRPRAVQAYHVDHADALRHARRSAFARALRATCRSSIRSSEARAKTQSHTYKAPGAGRLLLRAIVGESAFLRILMPVLSPRRS